MIFSRNYPGQAALGMPVRTFFGGLQHVGSIKATLVLMLVATASSALLENVSYAAPAFVQSKVGYDYPVNQLQITLNNVQAGHLLVVPIRTGNPATTTVTSSPGATWTKNVSQSNQINTWNLDIWTAPNVPGGNTTITITKTSTAHSMRAVVVEYSGVATTNPVDKTSSATGVSSSPNTGSLTTTVTGELLFIANATDSDLLGWSAGSGYTIRNPNCGQNIEPDQKICAEDRLAGSPGSYSGGFSINGDVWAAGMIALFPSGEEIASTPLAAPKNLKITP